MAISDRETFLMCCRVAWFAPTEDGWGLTLVGSGEPATSKTALFQWAARVLGLGETHVINFGEVGEAYAGCMPSVDAVNDTVNFPCPDWAVDMVNSIVQRQLVFLDEMTTDAPELRAAAMNLSKEKRVAGRFLGNGVRVAGACNPEGMGGVNTRDFAPAQANRVVHLDCDGPARTDVAEHLRELDVFAAMAGGRGPASLDAAQEESRVQAAWPAAWARAVRIVWDGFLRANGEMLHNMPAEHDPASSKGWASRRSWHMVTTLLASCEIQGASDDVRDELIAGTVGEAASVSLSAYMRNLDLPDPAAVLDGQATWEHNPQRPDSTFVALRAMADLVLTDDTNRADRATALWAILRQTSTHGSDLILDAVSALIKGKLYRKADRNAAHCAKILAPMLRAAGLSAK